MTHRTLLRLAALACACAPFSAWADVTIRDAYARAASPAAKAGAAFMILENTGTAPDRLLDVHSPAAVRVELHTHVEVDGVMQMRHVAGGFEIPAGGQHVLKRGGDHVMFMGLKAPWAQGDMIPVTFSFEHAGEMTLEIPVDLERRADD